MMSLASLSSVVKRYLTSQEVTRTMLAKKLIGRLLYLIFTMLAIAFLFKTFQEFLQGRTGYSVSNEDVTVLDLPALILCLIAKNTSHRLIYGKDTSLTAKIFELQDESIDLIENKTVKTMTGIELHLSEHWQTRWPEHQCYKVSIEKNEATVDFNLYRMQIVVRKLSPQLNEDNFVVLLASEENIYGLNWLRAYDGSLKYWFRNDFKVRKKCLVINIVEHVEHRNLEISCSHESYYQCLAMRFASLDLRNVPKMNFNNISCTFKSLCTPFSLPFKDRNIPICQTERDRRCLENVLLHLRKDQGTHCGRLCRTREYITEVEKTIPTWSICQENKSLNFPEIIFEYRFKEPSNSRGRFMRPSKIVHEEYFVMSWMSLVGNLGGTLGMFIGFSFIGVSEKMIEFGTWMWIKVKKQKSGQILV